MAGNTTPYILLIAGHRSVGDGGNPTERALTDDLAIAYRDTFRAAGYRADIVQELETGDPRGLQPGGLSGLAAATARHIRKAPESLVLALDLHFNGSRSGVHVIVPHNRRQDGRGQLSSGFVQGRVAEDVAENNTLDVTVAEAIAREIATIPGMTLWRAGRSGVAGVMLENETGVGNNDGNPPDNARLGMMGASGDQRLKAVRLTIEHGGTDDAAKPDFFNRCAQAALRAVNAVLADRVGTPSPAPDPVPDPDDDPEAPPTGDPSGPSLPAFLFGAAQGYGFDPNGPVSALWLATGNQRGMWPRLVDVRVEGGSKWFVFGDGSVIVAAPGQPVEWLESAA
jgi:hypothetical protein